MDRLLDGHEIEDFIKYSREFVDNQFSTLRRWQSVIKRLARRVPGLQTNFGLDISSVHDQIIDETDDVSLAGASTTPADFEIRTGYPFD